MTTVPTTTTTIQIPDGAEPTAPGWCYGCGFPADEPGYHRPGDPGFCYRVDYGGAAPEDPAELLAQAVRHVLLRTLDLDADDRRLTAGMADRALARVSRSIRAWSSR